MGAIKAGFMVSVIKKLTVLSLAVLLSACTQNNVVGDIKPINTQSVNRSLTAKDIKHPQGKTATPAEIAKCQQQGGSISKQGLLGYDFCVVEFNDKGKVCTDGSDCQAGRCVADNRSFDRSFDNEMGANIKGICPSNNIPFGCYGTVNEGKFGGLLCVD